METAIKNGLDPNQLGQQISFFFNSHNGFIEEIAKFRAAREIWAKIMKNRFNVSDEKATYDFPTSKNIAMSQRIADSWERQNYDSIIDNIEHAHSKNIWRKFIFQTTQTIFKYYG